LRDKRKLICEDYGELIEKCGSVVVHDIPKKVTIPKVEPKVIEIPKKVQEPVVQKKEGDKTVCEKVCEGLVGYYPFNGNADDLSGNGNDGNVFNASLTKDRDANGNSAYLFNGKDSYITFPTIKIHKSFTVSIILKFDSYPMESGGDYPMFAIVWDMDPRDRWNGINYMGNRSGDNGIAFNVLSAGGHQASYYTDHRNNIYYHLTGVYNSKKDIAEVYINGVRKGASKMEGDKIEFDGFKIGIRDVNDLMRPAAFNGVIDEVRVYDRALSSEEIYKIFKK
jgi:hypothetical protein